VINLYKHLDKWTKIGVNVRICVGNNQDNFTYTSSPRAKISRKVFFFGGGVLFDSHVHFASSRSA